MDASLDCGVCLNVPGGREAQKNAFDFKQKFILDPEGEKIEDVEKELEEIKKILEHSESMAFWRRLKGVKKDTATNFHAANTRQKVRLLQNLVRRRSEEVLFFAHRFCACIKSREWIPNPPRKKKARLSKNSTVGGIKLAIKKKQCNHVWKKKAAEKTIPGKSEASGTLVRGSTTWNQERQQFSTVFATCTACGKEFGKFFEPNPFKALTRELSAVQPKKILFDTAILSASKSEEEKATWAELNEFEKNTLIDPLSLPCFCFKEKSEEEKRKNFALAHRWRKSNRFAKLLPKEKIMVGSKKKLVDPARAYLFRKYLN